jgi:choline-sulfatase
MGIRETKKRNWTPLTRREFIVRTGLGAAALGAAAGIPNIGRSAQPAKRPNILFLMSDQHRWDFLGCMGHRLAQTPVLDRLASQGTLFDTAYCQWPVCVPSRMTLITGRYPHSHGALGNVYALPQDQQTIGGYLKTLGYQTGAIGKMHFVGEDSHHGFDYRIEKAEYGQETGAESRNPQIRSRDGKEWGISSQTEEQTYEHYLADKTIEWLEKNGDKPFCLWCSMIAPHPPFIAPEKLYRLYEGKVKLPPQPPEENPFIKNNQQRWSDLTDDDARIVMAAYLARITLVDMNMGRVLAALDRLGLADPTVVSYTADHGDMQWQHKLFGKMVMFDGATRIPFMLRYPSRVPKNVVRHEVVEHVDMYPTFCDLIGVATPPTVQGRSLVPLLEGKAEGWPNTAFIEMGNCFIVRTSRYKCTFDGGKARELYDVEKDPQEWINLIGKNGSEKTVAEMKQLMDEWMARTPPNLRGQVTPYKTGPGPKAKALRRAAKAKKAKKGA